MKETRAPLSSAWRCPSAPARSHRRPLPVWLAGVMVVSSLLFAPHGLHANGLFAEQRNEVSYRRGPYNLAFFYRHNDSFRVSAAIHFAHAIQHDYLALTPLAEHARTDAQWSANYADYLRRRRAYTEPTMEYYGPYTARTAWSVYRAIDWTHIHHEQTYDVMASKNVPWERKKEFTDRTVRYYLEKNALARSCAPLDVTMRRAAVMMKPYTTYFRNYYPESNNFFYAAHWWHPVVYEAQMIGGQEGQDAPVDAINRVMDSQVLPNRPLRMLLSREVMPRYSKLSPESANIFDNLHMLHGIVYDILAYEGWNDEQKRKELYRVVEAMSYQPGDELLAAKFREPHPNMDPLVYSPWMRGTEGEMNRIMKEMMEEMMPMMMPGGMKPGMKAKMMAQFKMKMTPGMQPGEIEGSLHDAMMKLMPNMKMDPASMEPGATPQKMVDVMLAGWQRKYGNMPDIAPNYRAAHPDEPPIQKAAR